MTWVISSLWFVLLAMMAQKGYQQRSGGCIYITSFFCAYTHAGRNDVQDLQVFKHKILARKIGLFSACN